jgi:hypothetical protein
MIQYQEPLVTLSILDFMKPVESRLCLESIRTHVKVPHKVVFCDNGSGEDYPLQFVREGLVDQLIVNRESTGLGLGTRDCMNASFSPFTIMMQNDQLFARDLTQTDFDSLVSQLGQDTAQGKIASINLAGPVTEPGRYSERAHLVFTTFYRQMEHNGVLGYHGAGKWHNGPWREAQIQAIYAAQNLIHWTPPTTQWVKDNGVYAVRDMGEGGVFCHRTDSKRLWVIVPPTGPKNPDYPKLTAEEWEEVLHGRWPDGAIPDNEVADSFDCWSGSELTKMEMEYVTDLRRRFGSR